MDLPVEHPPPSARGPAKRLCPQAQARSRMKFVFRTFISVSQCRRPARSRREPERPQGPMRRHRRPQRQRQDDALALLPRFFDPQSGRITLDGIDIRSATLRSLRRQISIVTQDSVIFPAPSRRTSPTAIPLADGSKTPPRPSWRCGGRSNPPPAAPSPMISSSKSRGVRHAPRRAGRPAFRRPEAAIVHRPRHPAQDPDPDPRRSHQPGGRRERTPDPAGR
jgi:hypothetical protein